MYCISINYKNTGTEMRSKFAFSEEKRIEIMNEAKKRGIATQCVLLCTCGRTEFYFCADMDNIKAAADILFEYGNEKSEDILSVYKGEDAQRHLFGVACGIKSMILGEDEILGQTKKAYYEAARGNMTDFELNKTFLAAITCAKKIKTETELSKTAVSIATLAANEAVKFKEKPDILVIGASGKIGSAAVKNLISHKNISLTVTTRGNKNENVTDNAVIVDYDMRYEYIKKADCIISATSSQEYTINYEEIRKNGISGKKLFIDLAVPPDIDEEIGKSGEFRRMGIDDFKKTAQENNYSKKESVYEAEKIIEEEVEELKKELIFHEFIPKMENVKKKMSERPDKILYKLREELDSKQFAAVLDVLSECGRV